MARETSLKQRTGACYATALRKASRRMTQLYDDALVSCGLRSTQYAIFVELAYRVDQPPTLAQLAEALVTDRSSLGHTLRPLERDGFITMRPGDLDRRQRLIELTLAGLTKYEEATALWQVAQRRFVMIYGEAESNALRATLLGVANDGRLGDLSD